MKGSSNTGSWWKTAESIITVSALVLSVTINIVQCSQTQASQRQAEKESRKSEQIQRQRDEWVRKLNWELRETRTSIGRLKEDSLRYRPRPWYADTDEAETRRRSERALTVKRELHDLRLRERTLEQQINYFLSYR
ncbi:MAG TPA: hypothetical protein VK183_02320 [Flavobacterium sp.]|nr:hypothetical protein [Flavobacterium sp.]